jgi:hypothetical protein
MNHIGVFCVLLVSTALRPWQVFAETDYRYAPVTSAQLMANLQQPNVDPDKRIGFIAQAYTSGRIQEVYRFYEDDVKAHPNSAISNMLLGYSAYSYLIYSEAIAHTLRGGPEADALRKVATDSARQAYALDPDSGIINAEYGYLLWINQLDRNVGLKLLNRSIELSPGSLTCHISLALALINPADGSRADLQRGIRELEAAVSIDPTDATAHQLLSDAYYSLGDKAMEAQYAQIAAKLRGGAPIVPVPPKNENN